MFRSMIPHPIVRHLNRSNLLSIGVALLSTLIQPLSSAATPTLAPSDRLILPPAPAWQVDPTPSFNNSDWIEPTQFSVPSFIEETLMLLTTPLDSTLLSPNQAPAPGVVTPNRVSQSGLTPPSLWWQQNQLRNLAWQSPPGVQPNWGCFADQFSDQLLTTWAAYDRVDGTPRRVDLLVDSQTWNTCNYLQRYTLVNRFGTTARDFGYNTRVFDNQGDLLAAYVCNFNRELLNEDFACQIFLNPAGRGALRSQPNLFGAPPPTVDDTGPN